MDIPKRRFSGYSEVLGDAGRLVWRHPIAFLPVLYMLVGVAVLILVFAGLGVVSYGKGLEGLADATLGGGVAFLVLIAIVSFLFFMHAAALAIGVFSRVAAGKEASLLLAFRDAAGLYRRVIGLFFASLVVMLPLLVILGLLVLAAVMAIKGGALALAAGLVGVLIIALIPLSLFYQAWFLFARPLLAYTGKDAWSIIGTCWRLLWNDARFVLVVFLIQLGLGVAASVVSFVLSLPSVMGEGAWASAGSFIGSALSIIISIWSMVFVFRSFYLRYKPKVA
ncbi:hypothetical protein JXA12_03130 [Candidatus Woesearchaeota archaeon]|nr:hypothetical protein [Candidatus Woesearchaeota archaeon]